MEGGRDSHREVRNDSNGAGNTAVVIKIMAEATLQDTKDLHPAVHSLVTGSSSSLGNKLNGRDFRFVAHTYELGLPTVTIISFYHLTAATVKLVNKSSSEDNNVRTRSTRKGAVNPDDLPRLDTHGNLVPHAWTVMLVAVPFRVPRLWLVDGKVSAIVTSTVTRHVAPTSFTFRSSYLI
jgi:hypothetical protein